MKVLNELRFIIIKCDWLSRYGGDGSETEMPLISLGKSYKLHMG